MTAILLVWRPAIDLLTATVRGGAGMKPYLCGLGLLLLVASVGVVSASVKLPLFRTP